MKNLPNTIYLQLGEDVKDTKQEEIDFKDLGGITWCEDKIHDTDIQYVLKKSRNVFLGKSVISKLTDKQHYYITLLSKTLRELSDEGIITDAQRNSACTYVANKMVFDSQRGKKKKI